MDGVGVVYGIVWDWVGWVVVYWEWCGGRWVLWLELGRGWVGSGIGGLGWGGLWGGGRSDGKNESTLVCTFNITLITKVSGQSSTVC